MSSEYHAVSVRVSATACSTVREFGDTRFLSREAPLLPVPGCSCPDSCRCRYRHWEDRRQGPRRDADHGLRGALWTQSERRSPSTGRRSTDQAA
ncbi:MAG: hypothetical protein AAGG11_17940 [Pseudomonadota bacterium]